MPQFSQSSASKLATCHPDLIRVFNEVVKGFDCIVLEGHRDKAAQDAAVAAGNSKTPWPTGKHNSTPSNAADVAPAPLDWKDTKRFYYFAGYVIATARSMGVLLRYGGDWNSDTQVKDNNFADLVHFEIAKKP